MSKDVKQRQQEKIYEFLKELVQVCEKHNAEIEGTVDVAGTERRLRCGIATVDGERQFLASAD